MVDKTTPVRTVNYGFEQMTEKAKVDINLSRDPHESGLESFADYGYNPMYSTGIHHWQLQGELADLVSRLQLNFPVVRGRGIGFDREYATAVTMNKITKPAHLERWTLLPATWQLFGTTYWEAVSTVLSVLKEKYPARGVIWSELEKVPRDRIVPSQFLIQALHRAAAQQKNHTGLLLVPVQLGRCYAGRSVQHVSEELVRNGGREVGFGLIEMALFLLYHPERLGTNYDSLWIDTPGTHIKEVPGQKLQTPFFRVTDLSKLEIRCSPVTEYDARSGVATFYA